MSRCEETSSNNTDLESGLSSVSHSAAILPDTTTGSSCLFYPPAGHEIGRPKSLPNLSIPSLSKLPLSSLSIKLHRTATDRPRSPLGSSPSPTLNDWSRSPTLVLPMPLLSSDDHEFPRGQSMLQRLFDRSWVQPAIGLTTLLITLIALFVYSHRSFVMAKWTEKNDILQACAQLIQVRSNTTYPQCQAMLSAGPTPPPYIKDSMFHSVRFSSTNVLSRALDSQNVTKKILKSHGHSDFRRHFNYPLANLFHSSNLFGLVGWCLFSVGVLAAIGSVGIYTRNRQKHIRYPHSQGHSQETVSTSGAFRTTQALNSTTQDSLAVEQSEPCRERVLKQIRRRVRPYSSSSSRRRSDPRPKHVCELDRTSKCLVDLH